MKKLPPVLLVQDLIYSPARCLSTCDPLPNSALEMSTPETLNMDEPTIDVDTLLLDPSRFLQVPTISCETPIVALVESCLRWQSGGVPFVIKGVRLDGRESPFLSTEDWQVRLPRSLGEHNLNLQNKELTYEAIVR